MGREVGSGFTKASEGLLRVFYRRKPSKVPTGPRKSRGWFVEEIPKLREAAP